MILFASIAGVTVVVVAGAWFAWQSCNTDDAPDAALPATTTVADQASTTTPTTAPPTASTTVAIATTIPGDLVAGIGSTGVFIGSGSDADRAALEEAVAAARANGWDLSVVAVPEAPEGGESEYAVSVAAAVDAGTVVIVTPDDLGWATRETQFLPGEFDRARSLIPANSGEANAVWAFVRSTLGGAFGLDRAD